MPLTAPRRSRTQPSCAGSANARSRRAQSHQRRLPPPNLKRHGVPALPRRCRTGQIPALLQQVRIPPGLLTSNTDAAFDFVQRFGIPDTDESSENENSATANRHEDADVSERTRQSDLSGADSVWLQGSRQRSLAGDGLHRSNERTSPSHEVRRRSRHSSSGRLLPAGSQTL